MSSVKTRSKLKSKFKTRKMGGVDWQKVDSVIYGRFKDDLIDDTKKKVAAFDFDSTLAITLSKKKFAENESDWIWWDDGIKDKLNELYADDWRIIIISNQKGISKGSVDPNTWKMKLEQVANELNIPLEIFAATENDRYRKPMTGIWDRWVKNSLNSNSSFYVGDAAGRKRDFSDSDRKMALNAGIKFYTPEMFFRGEDERLFNFKYGLDVDKLIMTKSLPKKVKLPSTPFLIVNVGYMGSGKTTYSKKLISDNKLEDEVVWINQDTLKTAKKCIKACEKALKEGKSVIIDNTNPTIDKRKEYIELANKYKIKNIVCHYFDIEIEQAIHNNLFRHYITKGDRKIVPKIAFYGFRKKFEKPTEDEGFKKIVTIPFVPNFNGDKDMELKYKRYYQ